MKVFESGPKAPLQAETIEEAEKMKSLLSALKGHYIDREHYLRDHENKFVPPDAMGKLPNSNIKN